MTRAFKYAIGIRDYTFFDKMRDRNILTHIWYPVASKTKVSPYNPRGPFMPVIGALNVSVSSKKNSFPVVLLSHGSMGIADRLFWLAEYLVKNGIIVIAVNHPGNMFGNSSAGDFGIAPKIYLLH